MPPTWFSRGRVGPCGIAAASDSLRVGLIGQQVGLVQHQDLRRLTRSDFLQRGHHMRGVPGGLGCAGVDHVQQQLGFDHLFERGAERAHQSGRQVADESDSIANQHLAF
jgi:hypothetical protein